jgi:hypothetical protein
VEWQMVMHNLIGFRKALNWDDELLSMRLMLATP